MLKRLFWAVVGVGFGFGLSFWVTRVVREKVARFSPEHVSSELIKTIRQVGRDLGVAVSEGAVAMREREAELREQVESSPAR